MRGSEVSTSAVKCSEVLSNRVSTIIRIYRDHMKFAVYMAYSFIISFHSFGSILSVHISIYLSIYIYIYIYIYTHYVLCFVCFCLIL
jgi:hypothetical protein